MAIGGDFTRSVGEWKRGDEKVMGSFGVKDRDLEGHMLDFAQSTEMAVVNI